MSRGQTSATPLWTEYSVIKTYGPRGTAHLLPARDLPMWTGALSALPPGPGGHPEGVCLTSEQIDEVVAAIERALKDADLTADELSEAVIAATGSWAGELTVEAFQGKWPRWRLALPHAGMRGAMCFGPNRNRKATYTNPRRRLPGFEPAEPNRALSELVRHYLYAYGPATPQRFAQWLAVSRTWATELFASISGELQQVQVNGTLAWVATGDAVAPSTPPRGVRLLPYFDSYAYRVGNQSPEVLYPGRAAERARAGNFQVLLVDGVVAGVWHGRRAGRKLDVTVEPLASLSARQRRALDDQVGRIGDFLEAETRVTIGTVTTGGHA
jgi:hypothetical protein